MTNGTKNNFPEDLREKILFGILWDSNGFWHSSIPGSNADDNSLTFAA